MREPETRALPRAKPRDVLAAEPHRAARRGDLAGEDVDERRLPRPVRADHRAALSLAERERDAVEGHDAAEGAAQLAYLDHRRPTRSHAYLPSPIIPCRAKSTNAMNTRPRIASDIRRSGGRSDGTIRSISETRPAPTTGPPMVPAPPTRTAYFSTKEKPGVVFLVAATWPFQPLSRTNRTMRRVIVAIPLALARIGEADAELAVLAGEAIARGPAKR